MLSGFGNLHASEAIEGVLPTNQNSPQKLPHGLYAEQISGSAFTRNRHQNLASWVYRRLPSVIRPVMAHRPFEGLTLPCQHFGPNPVRWSPLEFGSEKSSNFIESLRSIASNPFNCIYLYQCNKNMVNTYFANLDGELLFIPYEGTLLLKTELGELTVQAGQIAVIPRGMYFQVELSSEIAKGYLYENMGEPLTLPELGVVGANGLAHPNHFLYPEAKFQPEVSYPVLYINKYRQQMWQGEFNHTPLNVVAWRGNLAPYSYDLSLFNTINTVSYDHPDPSIFTVLTSPSNTPGVANVDFVLFPPRWMVAENTFRPPYFHRNVMSEFMGLIYGQYDAKESGFNAGGFSIHNAMIPHGPDTASTVNAQMAELSPSYFDKGLAFMLESNDHWLPGEWLMSHPSKQQNYATCWHGMKPASL